MNNFISDFKNFYKYLSINSNHTFFIENKFIYQFLKPYLNKRYGRSKIISFESIESENLENFYIFKTNFFRRLIFLMLDTDYVICSTPDLNNSIFQKSKNKKCKYIYIQHSPLSLTHIYDKSAFLDFDVVQAVNKFQRKEIIEINRIYKKKIKVFKSKYLFLENKKKNSSKIGFFKKRVLIAPTWHTNFYEANLHILIANLLKKNSINYVLRPHPMSLKKKEISVQDLFKNNIDVDLNDEVNLEEFDNLISDWSGIFIEFALIKKKKPILINTNQKIRNKENYKFSSDPIEIFARENISKIININDVEKVLDLINGEDLLDRENSIKNFSKLFY